MSYLSQGCQSVRQCWEILSSCVCKKKKKKLISCACICVCVCMVICAHVCVHAWVGGQKVLNPPEIEFQVFAQLVTWGLGSELRSSCCTPHSFNHWTPFSNPFSVFFESLLWGLTAWLRQDLNLASSHLRPPSAITACASLPEPSVFVRPFKLGVHGMPINRVSFVTNIIFQVIFWKAYLVCDMGMGIKPMASLMLRPHSQVLKL